MEFERDSVSIGYIVCKLCVQVSKSGREDSGLGVECFIFVFTVFFLFLFRDKIDLKLIELPELVFLLIFGVILFSLG